MDKDFQTAIDALYKSLTTEWSDNGNIMADAVRDSVITNLSQITGLSFNEVLDKIDTIVSDAQQAGLYRYMKEQSLFGSVLLLLNSIQDITP